ncbi:MAG: class I SAM-dependent methyltransferase [Sphingobacteriaceae bacterium]|nr:class I SAM-dependent methyltransferase [Sphingobacteriaceae bacterium]
MDKTKIAVDVFDKNASLYQTKFMDVSMYHDSFDLFCSYIPKKEAEILELACGPGNITKYLLDKRPDFKILGTDLAPNMIELAKLNNPSATFQLLDSRDIKSLNKRYDAIMCGFILPYLSKEETEQLIKDAALMLNSQGIIYISTMEDDYSKSGFKKGSTGDEIFMHYHQTDYLIDALKASGFKMIDLQRKIYDAVDKTKTVDLILIAQLS